MANTKKTPQGFVIDAPNAMVITNSGSYVSISASTGTFTMAGETLDIKGGQSNYNLASIPTSTEITAHLEDAMFNGDMFELFGAAVKEAETEHYVTGVSYIVDPDKKIEIPYVVKKESFQLNGFEVVDGEAATTGQVAFKADTGKTTLTFADDMVGKTIKPAFAYNDTGVVYSFLSDSVPKKGKVVLTWPVYTSEDGDASIAYDMQLTIFRAAVTPNVTVGGSYKTASTFAIDFKAENAHRPDGKVFDYTVFPRKKQ